MPFTRHLPLLNTRFVDERALAAALPGLAGEPVRAVFLEELEHSRAVEVYRRSFAMRRGPTAPDAAGWHTWTAIATLAERSLEEAIWLAYLTTFFGQDERRADTWRATRLVYSAFGEGTLRYDDVPADPTLVVAVCQRHAFAFNDLPRGNHRKFEPKEAEHEQGLIASVASLLTLVERFGGLTALFDAGPTPRERFERLMRDFRVVSFGRTGRLDLLLLLGELAVVALEPARIYLGGATGPLAGARRALPGIGAPSALDRELTRIADELGISIAVLEDTLCNWQKHF